MQENVEEIKLKVMIDDYSNTKTKRYTITYFNIESIIDSMMLIVKI